MSKASHTPGPWEAETLSANAQPNERPWIGRLSESRYTALSCGETQDEAVANARLIAAAPELLEALKSAEDALAEHCPGLSYLLDSVISPALAKAEGRHDV